jgi:hypothetical protein
MRARALTTALLLSGSLALAACDGGDGGGTGPDRDQLTRAEVEALNRAMIGTGRELLSTSSGASAGSSAAAGSGSFTFDVDHTEPCPPGGSVRLSGELSGSWDDEAQTGALGADFAVQHNACKVRTEEGTLILTGDPDIDVTFAAASDETGITDLVITQRGAFTWERGNGASEGRCTLDVTAELIPGTQQVQISGQFCGIEIDAVEDIES